MYDAKVYKCTTNQSAGAINLANFDLNVKFEQDFVYTPTYGSDKIDQLVVQVLTKSGTPYYLVSIKHDV